MAPTRVPVDFVHVVATISVDASEFVAIGSPVRAVTLCRADEHEKRQLTNKELAWYDEVIVENVKCMLPSITGSCDSCGEFVRDIVEIALGAWSANAIVGVGLTKETYEHALVAVLNEPTQSILRLLNHPMKECFLR